MEVDNDTMSIDEIKTEILECARYGEFEELREYIKIIGDSNHTDSSGNTALHKAAANGELECVKVLKEFNAKHIANMEGNFPLHWAAQNGKTEVVKYILENFNDIDVLVQNKFGRSVLTEAFQSKNVDTIKLILEHSSATEEKLMPSAKVAVDSTQSTYENNDTMDIEKNATSTENISTDSVYHFMSFPSKSTIITTDANTSTINSTDLSLKSDNIILRIRELPITRADNPFGTEASPDDDTTGLGIWPASVLAARWTVHHRSLLRGKTVVELGAGCGLPGLAAALYCFPSEVIITDIHKPTLRNAVYNVHMNVKNTESTYVNNDDVNINMNDLTLNQQNSSNTIPDDDDDDDDDYETKCIWPQSLSESETQVQISVKHVDWGKLDTYPLPMHTTDVIIGSDLVYDEKIVNILIQTIHNMLKLGGIFLYVAPIAGRNGADEFESNLVSSGLFECSCKQFATPEFYQNPLVDSSMIGLQAYINKMSQTKYSSLSNRSPVTCQEADVIDDYILHFYDLSIQKPHYLYLFTKVK